MSQFEVDFFFDISDDAIESVEFDNIEAVALNPQTNGICYESIAGRVCEPFEDQKICKYLVRVYVNYIERGFLQVDEAGLQRDTKILKIVREAQREFRSESSKLGKMKNK